MPSALASQVERRCRCSKLVSTGAVGETGLQPCLGHFWKAEPKILRDFVLLRQGQGRSGMLRAEKGFMGFKTEDLEMGGDGVSGQHFFSQEIFGMPKVPESGGFCQ